MSWFISKPTSAVFSDTGQITDSSRASTPYSGTLKHPAPHVPAQAPHVRLLIAHLPR